MLHAARHLGAVICTSAVVAVVSAIPAHAQTINACVQKPSGQTRLLAAGESCRSTETLVAWAQNLDTAIIRGRLVACTTTGTRQAAVPYAAVNVAGHSYSGVTDADGNFEINHLPPGTYQLVPIETFANLTPNPVTVTVGQVLELGPLVTTDLTSTTNCGSCGVSCGAGTCVNGACVQPPATCSDGIQNGSETGVDCGGPTCAACPISCPAGQTACNNTCVNTSTDVLNCGGCGRVCSAHSDPNATATCTAAACGIVCASGYTNCAGTCRDLRTDVAACGACGHVCWPGQTCDYGVCR